MRRIDQFGGSDGPVLAECLQPLKTAHGRFTRQVPPSAAPALNLFVTGAQAATHTVAEYTPVGMSDQPPTETVSSPPNSVPAPSTATSSSTPFSADEAVRLREAALRQAMFEETRKDPEFGVLTFSNLSVALKPRELQWEQLLSQPSYCAR